MRLRLTLLCCVLLLGLGTAHAQQTLYAATTNGAGGSLYTVNPNTAAYTLVGPLLVGSKPIGITGLAFNPVNGVLYGVTDDFSLNFPDYLVTINPASGAATVVGPLNTTSISDISFNSTGALYGWDVQVTPTQASTFLVSISLTTGTATTIGPVLITPNAFPSTPSNFDGGLAFNPAGVLYSESNIGNQGCCSPYPVTEVFEKVDPLTGNTTPVSSSSPFGDSSVNSMAFNAAGILFESTVNSDGYSSLYTVDPATGNVNFVGSLPPADPFDPANGGQTNALAFSPAAPAVLIGYAANLGAGDSNFNLTNVGTIGGSDPGGDICANVYVFAEDQQLIACCSCPLTPNHLKTLSARSDLILNTLTPGIPIGITVAFVPSTACDASAVNAANTVNGLEGWQTTLHAKPGGGYSVTEVPLLHAGLSQSELLKMTSLCGFIEADGSKFGICNSCREGAQGSAKK
jgi:hypothetical protein